MSQNRTNYRQATYDRDVTGGRTERAGVSRSAGRTMGASAGAGVSRSAGASRTERASMGAGMNRSVEAGMNRSAEAGVSASAGRTERAGVSRSANAARGAGAGRSRSEYVYGNTVRQMELQRQMEEVPVRRPRHEVRKNRDKAHHMSAGYVVFLAAALFTAALILVNYVQLQAELTNLTKTVAAKESELNSLKMSNDEEYNRVVNSIDLEEIRRIAMGELGMVYAGEGQIINYTNESNDYMRRVAENDQ